MPHGRIDGPFTLSTAVYSGPVPASTSQGQNGIWGWDETNPAARVPVNVGRGGKSLTVLSAESPTPMKYVAGYSVYVPAQYDPSKPAALIVWNDGQPMMNPNGDIRAMNVVDNLMWRREMPVAITVFLDPARPAGTRAAGPSRRLGRQQHAAALAIPVGGRQLREARRATNCCPRSASATTSTPTRRCTRSWARAPAAIAAFNVAWQRPNQFRKVISIVGSFTRIRGGLGDSFPELVAASEKKPIRVFMQDGRNDNRRPTNLPGDWFYQNVRLKDALVKKGYDVAWSWGIGNHGQKQGGAILPEMMRWLWRDHEVDPDPNNMVERAFRGPATKGGGGQ